MMSWTVQGWDEIVVNAPAERVWALLQDGPRLPEWMPMVRSTTGEVEVLDAERVCDVEFDGKRGSVRERCVEYEPLRRISWRLVDDSLGFGQMFADLGFSFTLATRADGSTIIRNESYYRPRSVLASLLSVLMMRRKFRGIRLVALSNLRRLSEAPAGVGSQVDPGTVAPLLGIQPGLVQSPASVALDQCLPMDQTP